MKGQASLEYTAISLISISLICVSVMALAAIKSDAERTFRLILLSSSANNLADAANEACAMGSGNKMAVSSSVPLSIESRGVVGGSGLGWAVRFSNADGSLALGSICDIPDSELPAGPVLVSNEHGRIRFRAS
jgi:hypothetical protein